MIVSPVRNYSPLCFDSLPSFSRRQVSAWNVLRRAVADEASWESWIAEGIGDLFESPAGFRISLRQRRTMDAPQPESVLTFDSAELTFGRDDDCDVRLEPRSIGKRHARI